MAATVSAWSKPGAWALDSEENESELLQQQHNDTKISAPSPPPADFPSLSAAAATKTKKKKPQTLSLQEFTTYKPAAAAKTLTHDELLSLPTGPRERSAEELDRNKLGGGFRSYGGLREDQPRRNRDEGREFSVSRADENDNWGAGKKLGLGFEKRGGERGGERGGFFGDSQSRADEVDNWGAGKKSFVVSSDTRRYDRRGSFGIESGGDGGADSGNWGKKKELGGGGAFDSLSSLRERRGGGGGVESDNESWGRKKEEVVIGGGGGRPKLNLQPRTLPAPVIERVKTESLVVEEEVEKVEIVVKPRSSNPFGQARPREEVLKEKGQDWKEIEEKLESKVKEVVVVSDGGSKRGGFWSGNGRERSEDKTERAWRRPGSVESRPQSASKSENGHAENAENGHAEEGDKSIETEDAAANVVKD